MLSREQITDFLLESAMVSTTESFVLFVSNNELCSTLKTKIRERSLSAEDIRDFVDTLVLEFQPGRAFHGDRVLGLIAKVVEHGPEPFADRYLRELADLNCAELPLAPRIAKTILQDRATWYANMTVKNVELSSQPYGMNYVSIPISYGSIPTEFDSSTASSSLAW